MINQILRLEESIRRIVKVIKILWNFVLVTTHFLLRLVRKKGLEPPRDFSHSPLKAACLPVSPLPHFYGDYACNCTIRIQSLQTFFTQIYYDISSLPAHGVCSTNGAAAGTEATGSIGAAGMIACSGVAISSTGAASATTGGTTGTTGAGTVVGT